MILEFSDGQRQREEHKGNRGEGDMGILKKEEAARAASVPFQGTVRRTSASVREERDIGIRGGTATPGPTAEATRPDRGAATAQRTMKTMERWYNNPNSSINWS